MQHVVLISKDVLSIRYLPIYGNKQYSTPNIDYLCKKGTVFYRHYTAAPSTAMAFTSMFTGKYPYETGRADYTEIEKFDIEGATTLFEEMENRGYECHLVWSSNYVLMAERFSRCYGKNTIHHEKLRLNQYVGAHMPGGLSELIPDEDEAEMNYQSLINEIDTIDRSKPIFLWVHLPHVFRGRTGYGMDIDLLDRFVGDIITRFGDCIYLTADHGSNDGKDGKTGYGFDVYESSIHIPLITPRIDNIAEYHGLSSNVDLMEIILNNKIVKHEYVLSDTAYYQQPHRKLAIISGNYKFVYDKKNKKKMLFDIINDSNENIDLNKKIMFDTDRNRYVVTEQVLYYPHWDIIPETVEYFNHIFEKLWSNGNIYYNIKYTIIRRFRSKVAYWKAVIKQFRLKYINKS